jgi:hypothetical protein
LGVESKLYVTRIGTYTGVYTMGSNPLGVRCICTMILVDDNITLRDDSPEMSQTLVRP